AAWVAVLFIGSEKVTMIWLDAATLVALLAGLVATTVGGVVSWLPLPAVLTVTAATLALSVTFANEMVRLPPVTVTGMLLSSAVIGLVSARISKLSSTTCPLIVTSK